MLHTYVVMWEENTNPVAHREVVQAQSPAQAASAVLSGRCGFVFSVTEV